MKAKATKRKVRLLVSVLHICNDHKPEENEIGFASEDYFNKEKFRFYPLLWGGYWFHVNENEIEFI